MQRTDRAMLRQQICHALIEVFDQIAPYGTISQNRSPKFQSDINHHHHHHHHQQHQTRNDSKNMDKTEQQPTHNINNDNNNNNNSNNNSNNKTITIKPTVVSGAVSTIMEEDTKQNENTENSSTPIKPISPAPTDSKITPLPTEEKISEDINDKPLNLVSYVKFYIFFLIFFLNFFVFSILYLRVCVCMYVCVFCTILSMFAKFNNINIKHYNCILLVTQCLDINKLSVNLHIATYKWSQIVPNCSVPTNYHFVDTSVSAMTLDV